MATPLGGSVSLSGNVLMDGLVQGGRWSDGNLKYAVWDTEYGTWDAFSRTILQAALSTFSSVANLTFTDISGPGNPFNNAAELSFFFTGDLLTTNYGAVALGVFPDTQWGNVVLQSEGFSRAQYPSVEGDIFLDNYNAIFNYSLPGGTGFSTLLHEIGHALGLKHPHDNGGNARPTFSQLGIAGFDNQFFTIMSYESSPGALPSTDNPATPMILDILALQYLYGANMSYNAGDNFYTAADNGIVDTLWDAGGTDTIDASNVARGVDVDMQPGGVSLIGITFAGIAYNALVEHVIGSPAADNVIGNIASNNISGNNGNDTLTGKEGDDTLTGGINDDYLQGNQGVDQVEGGEGNDYMRGGADGDLMIGGIGADSMFGDLGNDTLHGDQGDDLMEGGTIRTIDGPGDVDSLVGGEGNDTINGNIGGDTIYGGEGNDVMRGGKGGDKIVGEDGDDIILGDRDNDTLSGGAGIDVFTYNNASSGLDVIEDFARGVDFIAFASGIFGTESQALAAFNNGAIYFGEGSVVTLLGITTLSDADVFLY